MVYQNNLDTLKQDKQQKSEQRISINFKTQGLIAIPISR